jgi:Na+-driven multidrug efflux pump
VIIVGLAICAFRILWIMTVFQVFHTLQILCLTFVTSWVLTSIIILIYFRHSNWMDRSKKILDK